MVSSDNTRVCESNKNLIKKLEVNLKKKLKKFILKRAFQIKIAVNWITHFSLVGLFI